LHCIADFLQWPAAAQGENARGNSRDGYDLGMVVAVLSSKRELHTYSSTGGRCTRVCRVATAHQKLVAEATSPLLRALAIVTTARRSRYPSSDHDGG